MMELDLAEPPAAARLTRLLLCQHPPGADQAAALQAAVRLNWLSLFQQFRGHGLSMSPAGPVLAKGSSTAFKEQSLPINCCFSHSQASWTWTGIAEQHSWTGLLNSWRTQHLDFQAAQ